ncbi:MAG: chromate resistance protein ChrB domain-containing protein [Alphaproteobacteria bacterium]
MTTDDDPSLQGQPSPGTETWLLLIHQLPPKPAYFRVKIWRRLQALGAVGVKNSVYVLPRTDRTVEDLQWVRREIEDGGGEAAVCEARFVGGIDDHQIRALFDDARDAEYREIASDARQLLEKLGGEGAAEVDRVEAASQLRRLRKRFVQVAALDFFGAPAREVADGLLSGVAGCLLPSLATRSVDGTDDAPDPLRGRTWVTRQGIGIDRIASAWLIRRFIDPGAAFRFVPSGGYVPRAGEVRFDMFEAEFTHIGDRCTFEVLMEQTGLADPALSRIAEIVHDLDIKDDKFQREETVGIGAVISGLCRRVPDDLERLEQAAPIFDDLYGK